MRQSGYSNQVRFGLVGCGKAAQDLHIPAWNCIPEAKLAAICDTSQTHLAAAGALAPGARRYTDVEQLLGDSQDLGFIVLATPGYTHAELAEAILSRKLALLCEKPLALTAQDAVRMLKRAEEMEVLLTCIHNYRFKSNAVKALEVLRQGKFGDIVSVSVRFRSGGLFEDSAAWRWRERENRTLLFDWAIHFVDLALLILGPLQTIRFIDTDVDSAGLQRAVFGTLHKNGSRGLFDLMVDASSTCTEI